MPQKTITTKQAYNIWAVQYDTNDNKTRDLEASVLRETLSEIKFESVLEMGCGTGKNTEWLITKAKNITAVDFSDEMLAKAKAKIDSAKVNFIQADINNDWTFAIVPYDLVTFSLVLEHISNLELIFQKLSNIVTTGCHIYIGELHPFKQYQGSKARFETEAGQHIVTCFNHHISDFITPAKYFGFEILNINEHFDDNDKSLAPRILSVLLRKK